MIRFDCPTCGRDYLLSDALAGLPLLCKGCGQRLTPPAPQPDPEPEPPRPEPKKPALQKAVPVAPAARDPLPLADEVAEQKAPARESNEVVDTPAPLAEEIVEAEPKPPARPSKREDGKTRPPGRNGKGGNTKPARTPAAPAKASGGRRLIGLVVDLAVVLLLVAAGAWAGEQVVGKPTAEVLAKAGDEPFPPTDVLAWAGCPAVLVLIYAWLGARGWTVGAWLRRGAR